MANMFPILGVVVVLLLAVAVAIMIRDRVSASTRARHDGGSDRPPDGRLRSPQLDDLERHFGSGLPNELQWLYRDSGLVLKQNIRLQSELQPEHEYEIDHFLPADAKNVQETWFDIGERRFPFAIDGFGNYFFIGMSRRRDRQRLFSTSTTMAEVFGRLPADFANG